MMPESMGAPDYEHKELGEPYREVELELVTCQKTLLAQLEGRPAEPDTDQHLVNQVNASVAKSRGNVALLGCLTDGCMRSCVVRQDADVLTVIDGSVRGACREVIRTALGRLTTQPQ